MLQDTEDKRKEKRKQKVQYRFDLPSRQFVVLFLPSSNDLNTFFFTLLGTEALCRRDVTERGEEGQKGEEPSAGVEYDGSG